MTPETLTQLPQLELARRLLQGPILIDDFLELVPEFRAKYEAVVSKFHLEIDLPVLIDPALPANVGGAYVQIGNIRQMHLNPMHVLESEIDLARIFVHESIHAGIVRHPLMGGVTTGIPEEGPTDALTTELIEDVYKEKAKPSGYYHLVEELRSYMPGKSFAQLARLIDADDETTLHRLVEQVILQKLLEDTPIDLSEKAIVKELDSKWSVMTRLFPRLLNKVFNTGAGLHQEAQVNRWQYDHQHILDRAAAMINGNDALRHEILSAAALRVSPRTPEALEELLFEQGYGYAMVSDTAFWGKAIEVYCMVAPQAVRRPESFSAIPTEGEMVET
jgi:hypothetical protein